jgi:ribosome-binding factor A
LIVDFRLVLPDARSAASRATGSPVENRKSKIGNRKAKFAMSNRTLRVNELIQREISAYLHTRHQGEAVRITITAVQVSPDLHEGRVFYSVVGGPEAAATGGRWLKEKAGEIRRVVGQHVILKNVPRLEFVPDRSPERGVRVLQVLDEIERPPPDRPR